jgi:hypothetical protein
MHAIARAIAAITFLATTSVDHAAPPPLPSPLLAARDASDVTAPEAPAAAPKLEAIDAKLPADLVVSATSRGAGVRLEVRRPGHVVALLGAGVRAVGEDWVAIDLSGADRAELAWETTPRDSLVTTHGRVDVTLGKAPSAQARLAKDPLVVQTSEKKGAHRCAAHEDGASGFIVTCLVDAARVSAADVTGPHPLQHVLALPGDTKQRRKSFVWLDLPANGGDQARVASYVRGATVVQVRAEASWEGHGSFLISTAERVQPQPQNWF